MKPGTGLLFLVLLVAACQPQGQGQSRRQCQLFDTCVEVVLFEGEPKHNARLLDTVFRDLAKFQELTDPLRAGGMKRINANLRTGEWTSINPSLYALVRTSLRLYRASDGLVDPALWGAYKQTAGDPAALERLAAARPRMTDIELRGIRVRSRNPGVRLDFGLLTQARAVDLAVEYLQEMGVRRARVSAGHAARVLGEDMGAVRWKPLGKERIRFEAALRDEGGCGLMLEQGRFRAPDTTRTEPALDPASLRPSRRHGAVAVIHERAVDAGAACMALLLAPEAERRRLARRLEVRAAAWADENGAVHHYPDTGDRGRLRLGGAMPPQRLAQAGIAVPNGE